MMLFPWLELAVVAPLLGVLITLRKDDADISRNRRLVVSGFTLICASAAWLQFTLWPDMIAVSLGHKLLGFTPLALTQISAPLVPLTALLHFLTLLATLRTKMKRLAYGRVLFSESIQLATLASTSPVAVALLLAIGVAPAYEDLRARKAPTRMFGLFMGLYIALLLVGTLLGHSGLGEAWHSVAGLMLIGAVLVRNGMVPFHTWMPHYMEHAAFGQAILFITPMIGAYAAVVLVLPIASEWQLRVMALLSLFTAAYAAGMSLVQTDPRRMFAYLFLSNSSMVLVGFELATPIGMTGALCLWISAALALTGFGLTIRAVEARLGRISLREFQGLYEHAPMLGVFFLLTGLASIGFPGTIGFVGAELLVEGVMDTLPITGMAIVLAGALNGIAVMQAYFRIFTGKRRSVTISINTRWQEQVAIVTLALLIIGGGIYPQPGLMSRRRAVKEIHTTRIAAPPAEPAEASMLQLFPPLNPHSESSPVSGRKS
jgi:NADH-quinone oxidoreductase subunit M